MVRSTTQRRGNMVDPDMGEVSTSMEYRPQRHGRCTMSSIQPHGSMIQ
jgi:hypothetical protein